MKPCIIIPNYNHPNVAALLAKLERYNLPCIIVDDGSDCSTKSALEKARQQFCWVQVLTLEHNQGKGAAVLTGLEYAATQQNYTHAIQIDADGQHDSADLPKFLAASAQHPRALITGAPIYDQSVPKSRLYGRKITNFWVKIETLSCEIQDAMCGYRVYPIAQTLQIMHQYHVGARMDFDVEIIVRWYWEWGNIISLPTKVIYPPAGVSHFRLWRDNLAISWLHTRLFCGMLQRIRKIYAHKKGRRNHHWAVLKERGTLLGMKLVMWSYRFLGKKASRVLLYPITAYFYCFHQAAKNASQEYLARLGMPALSSFSHFFSFAEAIMDKFAAWHGDIPLAQIECPNAALFRQQVVAKRGGVILTAHLGNMEIARALSKFEPNAKINVVLFTHNAKKISAFLEKINPQFRLNIIEADSFDPNLAVMLQEKVAAGEFIVIAADRTSVTQLQRVIPAQFLGARAGFPEGPFILAGLLQCPVYFMLCLKQSAGTFKIIFEEFAPKGIDITRSHRAQQLQFYADKYAQLLEQYCRQYPLQWFNFFKFWV